VLTNWRILTPFACNSGTRCFPPEETHDVVVYDDSEFVTYEPLSLLDQHQATLLRDNAESGQAFYEFE